MTIREMFKRIEKDGFADESDFQINCATLTVFKDIDDDPNSYLSYDLDLVDEEARIIKWTRPDKDEDYELIDETIYDKDGKAVKGRYKMEETNG